MKKPWKSLLLVIAWIVPETAVAQLQKPPKRSKDDKHHATQGQHPALRQMAHAWAECLAPHVASMDKEAIRIRLSEPLQNQYSDHAVWNFRQALVELIQDDMHMSSAVFERGGRALIDGGKGVSDPLVEQLARNAVATSGGALHFGASLGGPGSLEHAHARVLRRDPAQLARIGAAVCSELSKEQRVAVAKLSTKYARELSAELPLTGTASADFKRNLEDALETTDTERAATGMRSKLREALRSGSTKQRKCATAAEHLALDAALNALVDEKLDGHFWAGFRRHHAQAIHEPEAFNKHFRAVKDVVAVRDPQPESREKNGENQ